jgi:hypothetical protein
MSSQEDSKISIRSFIVNNAVGIITLLFSLVGAAGVFLLGLLAQLTILEIILLCLIIAIMIPLASYLIWRRRSCYSYYYPRAKIKPDYIVNERKISYSVTADGLHYSRKLTVRSCRNYLNKIIDKFIWTGANQPGIPTAGKNVESVNGSDLIGVWRYFEITLSTPLTKKAKSLEFSYEWPIMSDYQSSSPFASVSTGEPTKKIIVEVRLGDKYAEKNLVLEEFQALEGLLPIDCSSAQFDEHGCYTWEIKRPQRFRYYRIRWNWNVDNDITLVQHLGEETSEDANEC